MDDPLPYGAGPQRAPALCAGNGWRAPCRRARCSAPARACPEMSLSRPARTNRPMTPLEWAMLIALSVVWGGSFFFNAVAVAALPVFTVVVVRVALGALLLLAVLRLERAADAGRRAGLGRLLRHGAAQQRIPFSLIVWGQPHIASGVASILNASTPLFTVILAHLLTDDERMTGGQARRSAGRLRRGGRHDRRRCRRGRSAPTSRRSSPASARRCLMPGRRIRAPLQRDGRAADDDGRRAARGVERAAVADAADRPAVDPAHAGRRRGRRAGRRRRRCRRRSPTWSISASSRRPGRPICCW